MSESLKNGNNDKWLDEIKKTPLGSKKFLAAMIWNIGWLGLIWFGIRKGIDANVLSAMVYAAGTVQALYLGGQSAVDAFVRAAMAKSGFIQKDEQSS
ncbi:MAG TPA: hypothetical protein EYN67_06735 [Flavobacteriales bacterium]|nr:hypothetical protein [Flavobacteriales bacterium]